jgi:ribosomal protein S18 acetylase RimI-like enzyme
MSAAAIRIERLAPSGVSDEDIRQLAELLVDAVESGAAVSFMQPLDRAAAENWWRETLAKASPRAIFVVARDAEGIAGTVQMRASWAPNQPHHGEIQKLIVHRRARGAGLGKALMRAIEDAAREAGFELLTLDAKAGADAEHLYRGLGWTSIGTIPDFAWDPDGRARHGAVVFYKRLKA